MYEKQILTFYYLQVISGSSYGIGGLFINEELLDGSNQKINKKVKLLNAGWQSTIDPDLMDNQTFDIKNNASSLELGCQHFPNIFSLGAALDFFNSIGIENIERRISELRTYLWQELRKINLAIISPEGNQSGITIVKFTNTPEICQKLFEHKVVCSARGEGLRISLHVYNNFEDIDLLIKNLVTLI